jgi:hypothetical protein
MERRNSMKVVINKCFGGYSLSALAIKELARLNGKKAYFFQTNYLGSGTKYEPITLKELTKKNTLFFTAFSIPNPNRPTISGKEWSRMSQKERDKYNETFRKYYLESRPEDRTDKKLIKVIEKLGSEKASGACAKLEIVEIPDGVDWEIDDYDGIESIHEKHQVWD